MIGGFSFCLCNPLSTVNCITILIFVAMEQLLNQIKELKEKIITNVENDAEAFRIKYLGTKGFVKAIMGEMKNVATENKVIITLIFFMSFKLYYLNLNYPTVRPLN